MEITTILSAIATAIIGFAAGLLFGRKDSAKIGEERAALTAKLEILQQEQDSLRDELEFARSEKTGFHERAVVAEARRDILEQELKKTEEKLRSEFRNTANNIFEDFSNKFSAESEKKIGDLLNPMREKLGEFQKMVGDSFSAQGKEQHSLKNEIEKIILQTDKLTGVLRGDIKAQGNWGEIMLERILEESGLRAGEDYIVQAAGMGLSNNDGARLQPDVIVNLPDNKHIIIDSKVSLTSYERFCNEADETLRNLHLKDFIRSIKTHIAGLEQKRYQDIEKLSTADFVLMFLPVEGAYSLAVQTDGELHSYAWGKKIVMVCPATLFATLRTVASIRRIERQNLNAQEIARQGGALYDKFAGFLGDMSEIEKHINNLHKSYDNALGKLTTGRGNILKQVENLKILGAKTSKSLPKSTDDDFETETDTKELLE